MSVGDYDFLFKIDGIGETGSGKKSLFTRYTQNYFGEDFLDFTGGPYKIIKKIEIDNKLIKCILYEPLNSPERYLSAQIKLRVLRYLNGIILTYDITRLESFKLIKKYNEAINENGFSNLKRVLVGTKCDLEDKREVTEEEGKKLAKELGINNFFEVSAKTGKNVEEAYYSLFREILMDYKKPIILDDKEKEDEKKNKCAK